MWKAGKEEQAVKRKRAKGQSSEKEGEIGDDVTVTAEGLPARRRGSRRDAPCSVNSDWALWGLRGEKIDWAGRGAVPLDR